MNKPSLAPVFANTGTAATPPKGQRRLSIFEDLPAEVEPLTPRERDIMDLLARQMLNREIALTLSVSPNTVKYHLRSIFSKLGVDTRENATAFYWGRVSAKSAPGMHDTATSQPRG